MADLYYAATVTKNTRNDVCASRRNVHAVQLFRDLRAVSTYLMDPLRHVPRCQLQSQSKL